MKKWFAARVRRRQPPLTPTGTTDLGPAWAGNSVNCVPFRFDAVRTHRNCRFMAYFDDAGDVIVARLSDNSLRKERICNARKPYDAHQMISIALDARNRIHVAFGAHGSSLLRTRSRSADLSDGFEELSEHHERATYPMFLTLGDGQLAFLCRRGQHYEGAIHVERLDLDRDVWESDVGPLISGFGKPWSCGPYLNTPLVAADGAVHLFLVWRLGSNATSAGAVVNVGIDALVSRDGLRSLATHNGIRLCGPVTPVSSERVIAVPLGSSLINQASAALLPGNRPAVLTYWDAGDGIPQYRFGWREGATWRIATVSDFRTKFRLDGGGTLPLPHSRPELVAHEDGKIIILYRSAELGNRLIASELHPPAYDGSHARHQILVDEDLGFYEPVLDRTAWTIQRELVLFVQRCEQGVNRDGKIDLRAAPARLMCWIPT
jgi:BNR repeat-containing family member